jgi:hypothetical protein
MITEGLAKFGLETDLPRPMAFGDMILLPYSPGDPSVIPMKQIGLLVHEATHCFDIQKFIRDRNAGKSEDEKTNEVVLKIRWFFEYMSDDRFRASEEARAMAAKQELWFWLYGSWEDFDEKKLLEHYKVSDEALAAGKRLYEYRKDLAVKNGRGVLYDRVNRIIGPYLRSLGF